MLRNEYRCFQVTSNKLPRSTRKLNQIKDGTESSCLTISQIGRIDDFASENSDNEEMFAEDQSMVMNIKLGL